MTAGPRETILARLRDALADRPAAPDVPRDYETVTPAGADVVGLFEERVADYRATVRRTTAEGLPGEIAALLGEIRATRVVVPAGVPAEWLAAAAGAATWLADDPPLSHEQLDAVDAVLTGCTVAIAETGTIVLDGGPGQGRRALSLLPDHHVCVVDAAAIVGGVPEALPRLDPRRALTWISGPSATSDIELERVEGVHGPRHLYVLIVEA